jgi:hypothetical protein
MLVRKISDKVQIIGVVDPDAYAASTILTAAIDMADYHSVSAIILAGDIVSTGTIDVKATDSATSGGSYADITGKAITQLTEAGTDSNKQVILNVRSDELNDGARYVKFSSTLTTAGADYALVVLGVPRFSTESDLSTVDEIKG